MKRFTEIIMQMSEALDESWMKSYGCYFSTKGTKEIHDYLNSSVIEEYQEREEIILIWCKGVFNSTYNDVVEAYSDTEIDINCTFLSDLHKIVNSLSSKWKIEDEDNDNFANYVSGVVTMMTSFEKLTK